MPKAELDAANAKIKKLHDALNDEIAKQSFNSGILKAAAILLSRIVGEKVDWNFLDSMVERMKKLVRETNS